MNAACDQCGWINPWVDSGDRGRARDDHDKACSTVPVISPAVSEGDEDDDCGCAVTHPRSCAWNGPCCDACSHGHDEAHEDCCGPSIPPGAPS